MCWRAELRTLRAAATADVPGAVGCTALLIASGSSRGMRYTKLDRAVNVDLPQPFAPAMIVSRGGSPGIRVRFLGGLLTCAFRKDFPQTSAVDRKLRPRIFCHLLCDFDPVHSHTHRIRPSRVSVVGVFEKEAIPLRAKEARRGNTRRSMISFLHEAARWKLVQG
jgi:hypothetical protein